jgi:hypothetical protein
MMNDGETNESSAPPIKQRKHFGSQSELNKLSKAFSVSFTAFSAQLLTAVPGLSGRESCISAEIIRFRDIHLILTINDDWLGVATEQREMAMRSTPSAAARAGPSEIAARWCCS